VHSIIPMISSVCIDKSVKAMVEGLVRLLSLHQIQSDCTSRYESRPTLMPRGYAGAESIAGRAMGRELVNATADHLLRNGSCLCENDWM